jgi:hypothetical protein
VGNKVGTGRFQSKVKAANRTPHPDALGASHLFSSSQSRAGGRGRYAVLRCGDGRSQFWSP